MAQRDQSQQGKGKSNEPTAWHRLRGLREHSLVRLSAAYAVAAWVIVQVAATVGPAFDLPHWFLRAVIVLAVLGFLLTVGIMALRQRGQSAAMTSRRRRIVLALGLAGLAAGVAGIGFLAREAVLGEEKVTIAVLPFADLSPGRDKAYFAEGVAEEILSALATDRAITVLGRTSARQLSRNPDPAEVRRRLGVTHMLEGSARTAGEALRVNVRLIETANGQPLWEERYDGRLADVFKVQDEIARTVVRRLRGTFEGRLAAADRPPIDAYEAYLAARALMRDPKRESLERTRRLALRIVEQHPDYALGHALLAEVTWLLADGTLSYGTIPADQARRIAVAHAREAIRLDPNRAEGHAALGLALPAHLGLKPLEKAIALDRSWAILRLRLGIALTGLKRHDEAFEQYRLAIDTDPLAPAIVNRYIFALAASGQRDEALRAASLYLQRGGSEAQTWRYRGNVLLFSDLSGSLAARRRALALDPGLPYQHEWLARGLHLLGLGEQANAYNRQLSRYFQLFYSDNRGALKDQVARDGSRAWTANGVDVAVFSLARGRDWPAIARFYDTRPPIEAELCTTQPRFTPLVAMALAAEGRTAEARRLMRCAEQSIDQQLTMRHRSPDDASGELEMWKSSLLAMRGDARAFDWLGKAVDRGWMGQYYSSALGDWPQFDRLRGDARYAAIQRRVDARIAKERSEVVGLIGDGSGPG